MKTNMTLVAVAGCWLAGSVAFNSHADNHVLNLTAVGQYMQAAHHPSQNTGAGGITVEFWTNWTGGGPNARWVQKSAPSTIEFSLHAGANAGFLRGGPPVDVYYPGVPMGTWAHVAGTWNGGTGLAQVYVNGVLIASDTGFAPTVVTDLPILIGMQPGYDSSQMFGKIDNVRLWNYARTQQQIVELKNVQLSAVDVSNYPGLIASWSFEDGATDATGVNNGTLFGGASLVVDNSLSLNPPAPPCPGDLDETGSVNGVDLAIILTNWGTPSPKYPRADTNNDGIVDGVDLATVLGGWGACP